MYKYSVIALVIVGLGFGWYQSNLKEDNAILAKETAESQFQMIDKQLRKINADLDRVEKLITDYQKVKQEIQYVDREVTKQVIEYRDRVTNRCQLNGMWVSTYNLSTLSPAESAARTDATTPGNGKTVDDALALEVTTRNNRQCVTEKERLRTLQAWVRSLGVELPGVER